MKDSTRPSECSSWNTKELTKQNAKQIRGGAADCSNQYMHETFKWNEKRVATSDDAEPLIAKGW